MSPVLFVAVLCGLTAGVYSAPDCTAATTTQCQTQLKTVHQNMPTDHTQLFTSVQGFDFLCSNVLPALPCVKQSVDCYTPPTNAAAPTTSVVSSAQMFMLKGVMQGVGPGVLDGLNYLCARRPTFVANTPCYQAVRTAGVPSCAALKNHNVTQLMASKDIMGTFCKAVGAMEICLKDASAALKTQCTADGASLMITSVGKMTQPISAAAKAVCPAPSNPLASLIMKLFG